MISTLPLAVTASAYGLSWAIAYGSSYPGVGRSLRYIRMAKKMSERRLRKARLALRFPLHASIVFVSMLLALSRLRVVRSQIAGVTINLEGTIFVDGGLNPAILSAAAAAVVASAAAGGVAGAMAPDSFPEYAGATSAASVLASLVGGLSVIAYATYRPKGAGLKTAAPPG